MKRFAFRLEKLLELRSFHEKKAELVLAQKVGRVALLEQRLKEIAESRSRTGRDRFAAGRDLADYRASELYIKRLEVERDRVLVELAEAELERQAALEVYVEKHRDRQAIDKLKERRQAEYYRAAEREEIKALDDLARRKVVETGGY